MRNGVSYGVWNRHCRRTSERVYDAGGEVGRGGQQNGG